MFSINLIFLATDPESFVDYCEKKEKKKKEHQGLICCHVCHVSHVAKVETDVGVLESISEGLSCEDFGSE